MLLLSLFEQGAVFALIAIFIYIIGVITAPKAKLKEHQIAAILEKISSVASVDAEKGKVLFDEFKEYLKSKKSEQYNISKDLTDIITIVKKLI
jgi:hypothetical protein